MFDWLLAHPDEPIALVIGFTTAGAFWYAYKSRPALAATIGLAGNALWWPYALIVGTRMLLLPVCVMTFIHLYNLRRGLTARRRRHAAVSVPAGAQPSSAATSVADAVIDAMVDALRVSRSGPPCPVCGHARGSHSRTGCGVILDSGIPCTCHFTNEETQ